MQNPNDSPDILPATVIDQNPDNFQIAASELDEPGKWQFAVKPRRASATTEGLTWYWDFGDGLTHTGVQQTYAFNEPGLHVITVTAKTDSGTVAFLLTLEIEIAPFNRTPNAIVGPDQTANENASVFLDGSGSFDADGDEMAYTWRQVSGPAVFVNGGDTPIASFITPTINADTQLVFVLQVSDGGQTAQATTTINVLNLLDPASVDGISPCVFTVVLEGASDSGALDGQRPLTVNLAASTVDGVLPATGSFTWTFDGVADSGSVTMKQTNSRVFNTAGVHTIALAMTVGGITVACHHDQTNSNEAQVIVWPMISGKVVDETGGAVPGATVSASAGGTTSSAASNGDFNVQVPYHWTGLVTVQHADYDFDVSEIPFSDLQDDNRDQQFVGRQVTVLSPPTTCTTNLECDDGLFCNGTETCVNKVCVASKNPCAAGQTCNESTNTCVTLAICTVDSDCDDGVFCNGAERCAAGACVSGTGPCSSDKWCNETTNTCETGARVYGTVRLVDTVGARPPIGQLGLTFAGSGVWTGTTYRYLVLTDSQGNYQQVVPSGWTGTVSATDPNRVAIMSPKPVWLFGTGADAPAVTSATRLDFSAWTAPIGIPMPAFGIKETHWMYQGQRYDFDGDGTLELGEEYRDAGNGPYTHYVDNTITGATDTNNPYGTPAKPRETLPPSLEPGSVVEVHGGPYNYTVDGVGIVANGTGQPAKPVFVRGANPSAPIKLTRRLRIAGSYIVVEHFDLDGAGTIHALGIVIGPPTRYAAVRYSQVRNVPGGLGYGIATVGYTSDGDNRSENIVVYQNRVHDIGPLNSSQDEDVHGIIASTRSRIIWFVDNEVYNTSGSGIGAAGPDDLLLAPNHVYIGRNHIHHTRQAGAFLKGSSDVIISSNRIHDVISTAFGSPSKGIGHQYNAQRTWMIFNEIYNCWNGVRLGSGTGVGTDRRSYIIGNLIHDIRFDGRGIEAPYDAASGLWGGAAFNFSPNSVLTVYGNTISNAVQGVYDWSQNEPKYLLNNIFRNITGLTIYYEYGSSATAGLLSNNLFDPGARFLWGGSNAFSGVDALRTAFPAQVSGCLAADPRFVEEVGGDYHLEVGSPAIDAGTGSDVYDTFLSLYGMDIRRDLDGTPRPAGHGYDIGAFEK